MIVLFIFFLFLQELNIDPTEVENLLVSCILDNAILGRIDQVNQVLELQRESTGFARYNALDKWTGQLQTLHQAVVNKQHSY
ncbi:hypothetical protein KUTeg_018233 [Tegillarca granosa]|uniref:COP9 signalosome complex subunit 2 n=1 Tax=Tegillarca granosa TaxID=220873 RepID=A0ABQ9EML0_TEGGR|nr:hypothetical protein KUTeg_018233 [Tegillarca granosa]